MLGRFIPLASHALLSEEERWENMQNEAKNDGLIALAELRKELEDIAPAQWHADLLDPLLDRIELALSPAVQLPPAD